MVEWTIEKLPSGETPIAPPLELAIAVADVAEARLDRSIEEEMVAVLNSPDRTPPDAEALPLELVAVTAFPLNVEPVIDAMRSRSTSMAPPYADEFVTAEEWA